MSDRMKAIEQTLNAKEQARREAGGKWVRRGECHRCGACCNARIVLSPAKFKETEADLRRRGLLKDGQDWNPICGNYGMMPDHLMGCTLHDTDTYPEGCREFPRTPEQWYNVAATCGYEFIWLSDEDVADMRERRKQRRRART